MQTFYKISFFAFFVFLFTLDVNGQIVIIDKYEDLEEQYLKVHSDDSLRVFNFWATWCKPCIEELPYFEELSQTLKGKKTQIYLISLDFKSQIESKLFPFVENNSLSSPVIAFIDPKSNTWIPKVHQEWSGAIPATKMTKGEKTWFLEGSFDSSQDLQDAINKML